MTEPDDHRLLARFYQDDDFEALARFVARYYDWAIAKASSMVDNRDAEDVVQTSVIRLMDAEPVDGLVQSPLGWWSTILGAAAMDHLRLMLRRREREQGEVAESPNEDDPLLSVSRQRLLRSVIREIDTLPDVFRATLLKRFFEDLTYEEISSVLHSSSATVGSRLSRSIARVRQQLMEKGILDDFNE
ncbi:MAG: RNA polymerase sigma factor [Pseudomonadota bacterium]